MLGCPESRAPEQTKVHKGLVQAALRERKVLERLLKFEAKRLGVNGRPEYHSSSIIQKSDNLLLRILVDEDAMENLKQVDFEMRIGASGKVKFSDDRASKKVTP